MVIITNFLKTLQTQAKNQIISLWYMGHSSWFFWFRSEFRYSTLVLCSFPQTSFPIMGPPEYLDGSPRIQEAELHVQCWGQQCWSKGLPYTQWWLPTSISAFCLPTPSTLPTHTHTYVHTLAHIHTPSALKAVGVQGSTWQQLQKFDSNPDEQ